MRVRTVSRTKAQDDRAQDSGTGDVDIPAAEWTSFLNRFSAQHEGWLASISVTAGPNKSSELGNCRLEHIALVQVAEKRQVRMSMFRDCEERLVHEVENPLRLTFKRDVTGAHEGLDIAAKDGSVAALRFRVAARPETLDGIMPQVHTT
jgi:hypothetical protein